MRKQLVKILQLLDGTPAVYGKRQTGQSVVELALVTPILIILFAGLVEIGWFANNYLTLLDVTRAGARRATTLQDALSPLSWNNESSYVNYSTDPVSLSYLAPELRMPYFNDVGTAQRAREEFERARFRACGERAFYNEIICTMIASMDPLDFRNNGVDDIIVSAFSLARVDASRNAAWLGPNRPYPGQDIPQMAVVGRYPTNANECDVIESAPGSGAFVPSPLEPRDPFDFNENGYRDIRPQNDIVDGVNDFTELGGFDTRLVDITLAEKQVGFAWFGHHRIPGTACTGSEWTMAEIEQLVNLPNYEMTNDERRDRMPSQGLVMVEMYWQHDLLLRIPIFAPVFTILGDDTTIYVWAAFPLPSTEPYIIFP